MPLLEVTAFWSDSAATFAWRDDLRSNDLFNAEDDFGIVDEPLVKPFTRASCGLLREEYPVPVFIDLSIVVEYVVAVGVDVAALGVKLFKCSDEEECS